MAVKHKNLYLYLALACFLAIILIFIFDGYMGVYDSLSVKTGECPEQKIEADQWERRYGDFSAAVEWGGKAFFSYEVDNRWFSIYEADIAVSVLHEQEEVAVLLMQPISLGSFDKGQLEWVLDTTELFPVDIAIEQGYDFTVLIKRGDIERRFIIHIRPEPYPPKPVIIEPPR